MQRRRVGDAGVVDQDVDRPRDFPCSVDQFGDTLLVGHVAGQRLGAVAGIVQLGGYGLDLTSGPGADDDLGSSRGQRAGDRGADAAAAAGYDGHLTL